MQIPWNLKAWPFREHLGIREVDAFDRTCRAGENAGCVFCIAIMAEPLSPGNEVVVLSGFLAGVSAVVAPPEPGFVGYDPAVVALHLEREPEGDAMMFDQRRDLAARRPLPPWPAWFPPLRQRDAADLHDAVLRFCSQQNLQEFDWQRFYAVVELVWHKRLPIEPTELGAVLAAHGAPSDVAESLSDFYRHGRDLLVFALGRKPVASWRADYRRRGRRRVPATGSSGDLGGV